MNQPGEGKLPGVVKTSTSATEATHDEIPDPDEDNLDDLDELLDDFSSSEANPNPQPGLTESPSRRVSTSHTGPSSVADHDFETQLQEQMATLMGNAEESPEMQQGIRTLLQELSAAVDLGSAQEQSDTGGSHSNKPAATDKSFGETIQRTMQRMQASGDKATADAAATDQESDDILAQMLKEMQGNNPAGGVGEEDFSNILMTMMEQLTNKDILYDPMKELNDKFPSWMSRNRHNIKPDDLIRYDKQNRLIAEIVGKFEESTYSDARPTDREYVVERMQEMQAAGSPPADLVGDMKSAQDALQDLNAGCPQQ